ncbi:unnamed protein product, partial [Prorocentrum cordatum]
MAAADAAADPSCKRRRLSAKAAPRVVSHWREPACPTFDIETDEPGGAQVETQTQVEIADHIETQVEGVSFFHAQALYGEGDLGARANGAQQWDDTGGFQAAIAAAGDTGEQEVDDMQNGQLDEHAIPTEQGEPADKQEKDWEIDGGKQTAEEVWGDDWTSDGEKPDEKDDLPPHPEACGSGDVPPGGAPRPQPETLPFGEEPETQAYSGLFVQPSVDPPAAERSAPSAESSAPASSAPAADRGAPERESLPDRLPDGWPLGADNRWGPPPESREVMPNTSSEEMPEQPTDGGELGVDEAGEAVGEGDATAVAQEEARDETARRESQSLEAAQRPAGMKTDAMFSASLKDESKGDEPVMEKSAFEEDTLMGKFMTLNGPTDADGPPDTDGAKGVEDDSELMNCALNGFNFLARSPMGWRFQRWLNGNTDKWEEFGQLSASGKTAFKMQRAEDLYDEHMKRNTKVENMKQRTIKRGRMLNIDQIIKAQGGHTSASAVAGAYAIAEYAMKKAAVEPGWVE